MMKTVHRHVGRRAAGLVLLLMSGLPASGTDYYVATNGAGTPGTNWVTAFTNLATALGTATSGEKVYVAGHRFRITSALSFPNSGVTLIGGYQGAGTPGSNNPAAWPTIIQRTGAAVFGVARIVGKTGITIRGVTLMSGGGYANGSGGGLFAQNSTFTFADSTVISNTAFEGGGGGIYLDTCTATITNCTVAWNASWTSWGGTGGGIHVKGGTVNILNCVVRHNYAHGQNAGAVGYGGGVHVESGATTLRNDRIHDNWLTSSTGARRGHGVYLQGGATLLENCAVVTNKGQGIYYTNGTITVRNSILWFNGDDLAGFRTNGVGTLTNVWFCDVEDGDNNGLNGCIAANPLFADIGTRDFHLRSLGGRWMSGGWAQDYEHSPCIDAGDTNSAYGGEPSPNGGRVNIDAFANTAQASRSFPPHAGVVVTTRLPIFPGGRQVTLNGKLWTTGGATTTKLYVCWGPTDGGTNGFGGWANTDYLGANWTAGQAFGRTVTNLTSGTSYRYRCYATNSAGQDWSDYCLSFVAPRNLYVATNGAGTPGTNWATAFTNLQAALDAATTGDLVCVAGQAFPRTNQLNWTRSGFIVRGGYQGTGTPGSRDPLQWRTRIYRSAGTTRLLRVSGARDIRLEGVTLSGGSIGSQAGGGVQVTNAVMTLADSVITNNYVSQANGGGIHVVRSTFVLTNCTLAGNTCWASWGSAGGGISITGTNVTLRDCVIRDNQAQSQNNGTTAYGGGIHVAASGSTMVRNCLIRNNSVYTYFCQSNWFGAGLYLASGSTTVRNCTVVTNKSSSWVAGPRPNRGIHLAGGTLDLRDSIIWFHTDDLTNVPSASVRYCAIGNGDNNGTNGCLTVDPKFVDLTYCHLKAKAGHYTGGYFSGGSWVYGSEDSPLLDRGDATSEWTREPAPNGFRVNIGAYGNSPVASKRVPPGATFCLQ